MKVTGDFEKSYFNAVAVKVKEVTERACVENSLEELCHKEDAEEEKQISLYLSQFLAETPL